MILASQPFPRPTVNPFEREAQENATRTESPALHGTIAVSLPVRANSGRDTPGTFGHLHQRVFHNSIGDLANFLHVVCSFVCAAHVDEHAAGGVGDVRKAIGKFRNEYR